MRSDWHLPICSGSERIRLNGRKAHSTQKPEALLYRVILSSSNPGDVILDPFFGSGTTGAVAQRLSRNWIGIERDAQYIQLALQRIEAVRPEAADELPAGSGSRKRREPRVAFGSVVENGLLHAGALLFFRGKRDYPARVNQDGSLVYQGVQGSIHRIASSLVGGSPCNGWDLWYYETAEGELHPIDELRQVIRDGKL